LLIAFELTPAQADRLRTEAARLGIPPAELAHAAVTDLLAMPDSEFAAASARVVAKNHDLYRRLV
jgi:hypothetical protein